MDPLWRYLLLLLVISSRLKVSVSSILESIYWNTSNTKFIPGKGLILYPQIGDKMDIVCPRLRQSESQGPGEGEGAPQARVEYFRVYLVKAEQLESCRVSKDDVALLNCDKPDQDVKFTFKFQEFSPNLWGLEFLKGEDYHIISTSNSSLEGLNNLEGGVCKSRSMKLILRVGQNHNHGDPVSGEDVPPKSSDRGHQETLNPENDDLITKVDPIPDGKSGESVGVSGSEVALFIGVAAGGVVLLIVTAALTVFACRRYRECPGPSTASPHAVPKRGPNNNGSERSDIIFPLRPTDSFYCPHYEKVSGDYGHPVYIVQEMEPQSPANVYYKV